MRSIVLGMVLVGALAGCPIPDEDYGTDPSTDTGADDPEETDESDPLPPPECEGTPLDPDGTSPWPTPSSLGNGFVHDTRVNLDETSYTATVPTESLAAGVAWTGKVHGHDQRTEIGFRPGQVRAHVLVASSSEGSTTLEITDQTVYIADDDANYRTEIATYLFADTDEERQFPTSLPQLLGARPTSIDMFGIEDSSELTVGFSLAWVYDDSDLDWQLLVGQSQRTLLAELERLGQLGYRPISLSSRTRGQTRDHAAIVVRDGTPPADWAVTLGLDPASFEAEFQVRELAGFHPFRVDAEQGPESLLDVLWIRRPPGIAVEIVAGASSEDFMIADARWRSQGHHLESVATYENAGQPRHVAIWLRYEPYLRWQGTQFDETDAFYANRYAMFHDQAIRQMSFATGIDCSDGQRCPIGTTCFESQMCVQPDQYGKVLRPSGTLHVFEADSLVLSRAYTFAPAVYPDTPLDVPMKLASVSKSITAAAVVRELDARSISLTESFVTAAGISGVPASMENVTVLDTLRAMGGFRSESDGYANHWIVADSPFGTIPIDGEEMLDHAILGGHLDTGHADSYWDSALYWRSRSGGEMSYSNIGYSMLGELVRLSAEAPYDDYVVDNLFAPLGLESRFFADPGHRRCQRGVTLAGRRAYLVNGGHPYNADSNRPVSPRFGTEPLPHPMKGDASTVWAPNAGPIDPAAPAYASLGRYSGEAYMGGAPLAAGGWHADGEALGLLIRELNQGSRLMPAAVAGQLWDPQWWNPLGSPAPGWSYGLGWYARGNWVAWAGGAEGSMATVLHNRVHDFTVVYLTNTVGNGLDEFMNPLMQTNGGWNTSAIGAVFSCRDEVATAQDECDLSVPY